MTKCCWIIFCLLFVGSNLLYAQISDSEVMLSQISELKKQLKAEQQKNKQLKQELSRSQEIISGLQQFAFDTVFFLEEADILPEISKVNYQAQEISEFEWILFETIFERAKFLQQKPNKYRECYEYFISLATRKYDTTIKEAEHFFKNCGFEPPLQKNSLFRVKIKKEWLEGDKKRRKELEPFSANLPAPELKLNRWLNSEKLSLEELKGKVLLLNFWAPW